MLLAAQLLQRRRSKLSPRRLLPQYRRRPYLKNLFVTKPGMCLVKCQTYLLQNQSLSKVQLIIHGILALKMYVAAKMREALHVVLDTALEAALALLDHREIALETCVTAPKMPDLVVRFPRALCACNRN
jgi:hypothetical protein